MYEYLDRRYAKALYQIALEKDKIREVALGFEEVCTIVEENKQLKEILEHPQISSDEKEKILYSIFKNNIDEDLLNFLNLLIKKDRISNLKDKYYQLESIILEETNTIKGIVKTCIKLSDNQYKELLEKLEEKYNKKIILKQVIDENLIGGVYLRIGNDIIDGTLAYQYDEMKEAVLNKK